MKSLKDLKGKTVSIGGQKDVTRSYLDRMLEPNVLKDSDVNLYAGASSARLAALESVSGGHFFSWGKRLRPRGAKAAHIRQNTSTSIKA
jgi:TRAP-type uncharacterized transport system substrate-binding protein